MSFERFLNDASRLLWQHPILFGVLAVVLLFLVYKNQKASFKLMILLLALAAFFYAVGLFSDVFSTGSKNRDQMINKSRNMIE